MNRSLLIRLFLSPDDSRLRLGWRLLFQFLLLQFLTVVFVILLGWVFLFRFGEQGRSLAQQALTLPAMTVSVWLARRFLDRRSFRSLGLDWDSSAWQDLVFGFILPGLLFGLVFLIEWAAGWLWFESVAWETGSLSGLFGGLLLMLAVFILVGWNEELLCRGYQLHNLIEGLNLVLGVLLSSAMFAALHISNPAFSQNAMPFVGLFAGGLFFAFAFLRTQRLWLPIGLHIGWNFFEGPVFGFPVSGLSSLVHLVNQSVQGPELVTGAAFGPEAGLIMLPVLAIGALLVALYTRRRSSFEPEA